MSAFGQQQALPTTKIAVTPTDEQQENIDVFNGGSDLVIEAGAGTGKSSQLKMAAAQTKKRGLVLYFNRAPAEEAKRLFAGTTTGASTAHALARSAMKGDPCLERLNGPTVTAKWLAEDVFKIHKWFNVPDRKAISTWKIASLAVQTVRKFCYSDATEIQPWHVPQIEGITGEHERRLRFTVLPYAREIWEDVQKPEGFAYFEHDHYMKMWALTDPQLPFDWLAVDESQDTNGVLAGVVRNQNHLQRVLVGDSQQRLFAWRGTVDIMGDFPEAEVRYLTQSFRFGQAVAEEANRWLDYLSAPIRLRGLPSINSRIEYIEHPDAILCRTNADVIEQAMAGQDRGMDVAVVGGTKPMYDFAGAVDDLRAEGKCRHPELSVFKSWMDVMQYVRDEKPGGNFSTMVNLIDRYGTAAIKAVAAKCVDPSKADFVVSTVHKVKGLEWPQVLLDPGIAPDQALDQEEMSRNDLMVSYVASTRAQQVLDATAVEPFHRQRALRKETSDRA